MRKTFSWYMMKLDRVAAWTLLATMVLYFISGYGMTKGIISGTLSVNIHNHWLPLILLGSFCFHTFYAICLAFKRWGMWTPVTKYLLLALYLILFATFVYINNYYKKPIAQKDATAITTADTNKITEPAIATKNQETANNATTTTKTFTATELAKYNGQNGAAAYIAVSGKVYDVSGLFVGGTHRGCQAGQDVTSSFSQIHDTSFLRSFTVVGNYSG